jgi:hypothetical protein
MQYPGLVGHDGPVLCIALSPDGRSIVSGSADHTVRAWDVTTGSQQWVAKEHCLPVTRVVFSHDGRLIMSCSEDSTTQVHYAATGSHPPAGPVIHVGGNDMESVRFSPDDKYILSQHDGRDLGIGNGILCVWNATTGIDVCYSTRGTKRSGFRVFMPSGQRVRDPVMIALVRAYWKDKSVPLPPTLPCDVEAISYDRDNWVWRIRHDGSGARQRVCWLPAGRRGRAWVARGHVLWVGGESGAITALNLEHVQAFKSPSPAAAYSDDWEPSDTSTKLDQVSDDSDQCADAGRTLPTGQSSLSSLKEELEAMKTTVDHTEALRDLE